MKSFCDRVAVVTGGGSGIAQARGHVVNTESMAGLIASQEFGVDLEPLRGRPRRLEQAIHG